MDTAWTNILWNSIQAEAAREAFEKLNYREQTLLENGTPSA